MSMVFDADIEATGLLLKIILKRDDIQVSRAGVFGVTGFIYGVYYSDGYLWTWDTDLYDQSPF